METEPDYHQAPQIDQLGWSASRVKQLQEWLKQPSAFDFRQLLRSHLTLANFEAAFLLKQALQQEQLMQSAKDKAQEARMLEEFLILLDDWTSGKKRGTEEGIEYIDVTCLVPKTNTTKN